MLTTSVSYFKIGGMSHDGGILGRDAVAWRVLSHPGALIGGLRALVIQSLHPLAMAGVAEHSDYQQRPLKRLQRTSYYVAATVFGDTATAHAAATKVRNMHARVRGTDPVTGREYSADDPETQVWVHMVEWHSFLAAYRVFGGGLSAEDEDCYLAEGVPIAQLVGTPAELVPDSVAAAREYFAQVRPGLCVSDAARTAIDFVLSPPRTRDLLPYRVPLLAFSNAARALVPRALRVLAGIDRPRALDVAAIAAARPVLASMRLPGAAAVAGRVVGGDVRKLHVSAGVAA
jgi:uncharacterized protein (DUF2236 family)